MAGAGVPVSMTTIILIGEMRKKTKKQSWGLKPIKKKFIRWTSVKMAVSS